MNWYKKAQQKDFSFLEQRPSEEEVEFEQFDQQDQAVRDVISEFAQSQPDEQQPWPVVPFGRLKKIWEDYMRHNVVHDEKGLEQIANRMIENTHRLYANTYLMGHTEQDPSEHWEEHGLTEEDRERFWDNYAIDEERGQARISDYGLGPLQELALKLAKTFHPVEKIMLIDRMLNVVHQRSDLAAMFIEGGSRSLNSLFGSPSEVEASNQTWYKKAQEINGYLDIGHRSNDDPSEVYLWTFIHGRLETIRADKTRADGSVMGLMGHQTWSEMMSKEDRDAYHNAFSGRFDTRTKNVSIANPHRGNFRSTPSVIIRALYGRFGNDINIHEF